MKFLFESSQTAAEVAFQLKANWDGLNCIDFVGQELEDIDLSGIDHVVESLSDPSCPEKLSTQFCAEKAFCFCCHVLGKIIPLPHPTPEAMEKSLLLGSLIFDFDGSSDEELALTMVQSFNQEVNPAYYTDEISEIARQFAELI